MIKSNTCPHCGAAYTISHGGCANKCADSQRHQELYNAALDENVREEDEGLHFPVARGSN